MTCSYVKALVAAVPALLLATGAARASSVGYGVSFGFPTEVVATNANYPHASVFTGFTGGLAVSVMCEVWHGSASPARCTRQRLLRGTLE